MGTINAEQVTMSQGTYKNAGIKYTESTRTDWTESINVFGSSSPDLATFGATFHESMTSSQGTSSVAATWDECNINGYHHGYAPMVRRSEAEIQSGFSTGKAQLDLGDDFSLYLEGHSYTRAYALKVEYAEGSSLPIENTEKITVERLGKDPCAKSSGGTESAPEPTIASDHLSGIVYLAWEAQQIEAGRFPTCDTGPCKYSCELASHICVRLSPPALERGTSYESAQWRLQFREEHVPASR
jgi:hypothetical protein